MIEKDKALTLQQLSRATGYSENAIHEMKHWEGFPLFRNKVFLSDFTLWRRQQLGLSRIPDTPQGLLSGGGHREDGSTPKNDLQGALPPRAERLHAEVG